MFGSPEACAPIIRSEVMMSVANRGPFISSHQKKPVNMVNLMNSAKNSPMSALRKAIKPNVQTMLMSTRSQNSQVALVVMRLPQVLATVAYRFSTLSITSSLVAPGPAAYARTEKTASHNSSSHAIRDIFMTGIFMVVPYQVFPELGL